MHLHMIHRKKKHMFFSIFVAISDLHIERTVVKKIRRSGFKSKEKKYVK